MGTTSELLQHAEDDLGDGVRGVGAAELLGGGGHRLAAGEVVEEGGEERGQLFLVLLRIGEIASRLAAKYQIGTREAELSLQQFFKEIGRRGYVGFAMQK